MTDLVAVGQYTPKQVAIDLMETIKDIDAAIQGSEKAIKDINERSLFRSIISSRSKDLVAISNSQNAINQLMLSMIQEIITFNVMSYSYLASVLSEFHQSMKNGWVDSEGRFQKLSENGEIFADTASSIFEKILEGSRNTQERIELNSTRIQEWQQLLEKKDELDEQQSYDIENLKKALYEKTSMLEKQSLQIADLKDSLSQKDILINEQSEQMIEIQRLLEKQQSVDEGLSQMVADLIKDLQDKELQGKSRDNSIFTIKASLTDLQARYKILSVVASVTGFAIVSVSIILGLVTFDLL